MENTGRAKNFFALDSFSNSLQFFTSIVKKSLAHELYPTLKFSFKWKYDKIYFVKFFTP